MRYAIVSRTGKLPEGWPAIHAALREMRRLSLTASRDPAIRFWTLETVRNCRPRDELCEVRSVLERMRRELRYVRDPRGLDLVQHPLFSLLAGGGDCDCLSTFFAAAGLALGWRVRFLVGARPGVAVPTHVLPEVAIGHDWIPVEVSSRLLPSGTLPPGFRRLGVVTLA